MSFIADNLKYVQTNIDNALKEADRASNSAKLIAVSKTKPLEALQEAYDLGIRDFGENKVQELVDKYEQLPKDIRFHMIGHLQKNKVKYLMGKVYLIHGVDTVELAKYIQKESAKANVITDILLEVNVANEESKFGFRPEDTISAVREIALLPNVHIKGLMTIAPYVENPEDNRQYFVALRELSIDIKNQNIDNVCMDILSMGMTGDYMVAISEGATYVRVGTGIFGARNYNI